MPCWCWFTRTKIKEAEKWAKNCPYCGSNHTQKKGTQNARIRYRCIACGRQFQNHPNRQRIEAIIWNAYVYERQTIHQLSMQYKKSKNWIRTRIAHAHIVKQVHTPQPIVAIADVTFFKRSFGILVIRAPCLKKNIYVQEVHSESIDVYRQGKIALERKGYVLQTIVLDGRPGVRQLFAYIPVQMCHFHQKKIITRYLTNNPKQRPALN